MELAQLMILVGFIGSSSMLFYIIINICLKFFAIHACEFNTNGDASKVAIIAKYIDKSHIFSTSTHGDKKPIGLVIGIWYIAYITTISIQKRDSVSIGYTIIFWSSIMGHKKSFSDDFVDIEKEINSDDKCMNTIKTWRHVGAYKSTTIEQFDISFFNEDCAEQLKVIKHMKKLIQTSCDNEFGNRLIVMIAGPSGTGKSQIAKQFAKIMNATISDNFNPTCAGENFESLIKTINPTKKNPLVVLLDEGDKTIKQIHTGIKEHEFFVTPTTDKTSYNRFMDRLGDYDNVFVIITMNSTFNAIDKLDPSYTRCGRIDLKVNFGGDESYNPANGYFIHVKPFANIAKDINLKRFTPKIEVNPTENIISDIKSKDL